MRRVDAGHEALNIAFKRRGRGLVAWSLRRRTGHHLPGEAADHRAHLQLRPAAIEDRLGPFDKAVDVGEIRWRQVVQAFGTDLGEVDLVQHRAKQRLLPGDLAGDFLKHRDHALARFPLHDHDGVVVLTELPDVVDPKLVVFALRIEQVDAADLVAQMTGGPRPRGHRRQDREHHHGERMPQADPRPCHQRPPQ